MSDEMYLLGLPVKESLDMVIRVHNELHDIVMALQKRVLELELQTRCRHTFKKEPSHLLCIHCGMIKGF